MFAWLFFRAKNFSEAIYIFSNAFNKIDGNVTKYFHDGFSNIGMGKFPFALTCITLLVLISYDYFSLNHNVIETISSKKKLIRWAVYIALGLYITFLSPKGVTTEFVYFQF